jgi:LPS export ABC transporter permease LptG/LPS export ABC transporter permease LptF
VRILRRYILGEVLSHAFIGGALFTFVLFMRDMPHILEILVRNSASFTNVVEIFLFTLPNSFTLTIPMAVLVGILLGLSRLAADSEITAMRASGVGIWSFVRIVAIVAVSGWLLGLANSLYLAPRATQALLDLENQLKNSQASFEVQPRVFYEGFSNYAVYVQDVRAGYGAAYWRRIFLADLSDPIAPKVTTAESATVINGDDQTLRMRLRNGSQHETSSNNPSQYTISTFADTDLPLQIGEQTDTQKGRSDAPILALSTRELWERGHRPDGRWYLIELHKRLAYPAACLVLMLVGVPLGVSSKRGGKSAGFILTIVLVFVYYFLSSTGVALGRQDKLPAFVGVWLANVLFAFCGTILLRQMATGGRFLAALTSISLKSQKSDTQERKERPALTSLTRHGRSRFPLILDDYVLREFLTTFGLVLVSFVLLLLVFTFFELIGDIIRNHAALITVGEYLINLTPSLIYNITPLCVLIAVLVTFSVLNRTNELTAMKATGISLYRLVVPVLVIAALLATTLFLFDEFYVPQANRKQEALRSVIKGKPAQTFLRPDRKWIFGQEEESGKPGRIFYYQFFDPDQNRFANISVFEFNPDNFSISKRIFATSAHWEPELHRWIFEKGWTRAVDDEVVDGFNPFEVRTFSEITEGPTYFKKESWQSQEMNFGELERYIRDLRQSGFDTMRLRVQLNRKLAYPLIALVMAVLAIPFSLSTGRRGSLTGIAVAIGVAVTYWVVASIFEAMGNVNLLPAMMAAWSPDILFGLAGGYLLLRTPT